MSFCPDRIENLDDNQFEAEEMTEINVSKANSSNDASIENEDSPINLKKNDLNQNLNIDDIKLVLNLKTRNKLIDKLKKLSRMEIGNFNLNDQDTIDLIKDNNELLLILNQLPALNDDITKKLEYIEESRNYIKLTESQKSNLKFYYDNEFKEKNITPKDRLLKFFRDIDVMCVKLKKFNPFIHCHVSWFKIYELFTSVFDWTDAERYNGLVIFLDISSQLIYLNNENSYQLAKERIFNFINLLMIKNLHFMTNDEICDYVNQIFKMFDQLRLTIVDRKLWLNCYVNIDYICSLLEDDDEDLNLKIAFMLKKFKY